MKEKIEILLRTLGSAIASATLEHRYAGGCHKIRLTLPGGKRPADFPDDVIASKGGNHSNRLCKQVAAHRQYFHRERSMQELDH